jgi:hypothetical protein
MSIFLFRCLLIFQLYCPRGYDKALLEIGQLKKSLTLKLLTICAPDGYDSLADYLLTDVITNGDAFIKY